MLISVHLFKGLTNQNNKACKGRTMKNQLLLLAIAALFVGCSPSATTESQPTAVVSAAEAAGSDIPRGPNGKPDLNGIWQVLMNANDNLEAAPPKAASSS